MQKFEIPVYIWLNAMVLFAAAGYVWGRLSGLADFHKAKVQNARLAT